MINTLLRGKQILKITILEKTTSLVQTELVKQLCSSFYLVLVELHWEGLEGRIMKVRILTASFRVVWKSYF